MLISSVPDERPIVTEILAEIDSQTERQKT